MVLFIWKRYVDSPTSRHKDYFKLCTQDFDIEKKENYWMQTLSDFTLFYMVNFKLILHFRLYWMHLFYSVTELTFFSFLSCVVTFQKLIWIITMKLKNKYKSMKEKQNLNIINSYFKIKNVQPKGRKFIVHARIRLRLICLKFYSKSAQITQYSTAVWMKWNEASQNVKPFKKKNKLS